ncbi:hypothetical protein HRED_07479 [Candidatus Haloredivivus sp. G17]|nr:hypothetical protein HRED_07479 [Candidatus Haloredivivus sp. G17]
MISFPNDKPELKEMNPSRRKKVNYGKTELFGEDAVIVKQHLPSRGLKEPAKYLLGQTLRHMDFTNYERFYTAWSSGQSWLSVNSSVTFCPHW